MVETVARTPAVTDRTLVGETATIAWNQVSFRVYGGIINGTTNLVLYTFWYNYHDIHFFYPAVRHAADS